MGFFRAIAEYIAPPTPTAAFVNDDNMLFDPYGNFVNKYSRKRDAVRGAKRRGWEVETA